MQTLCLSELLGSSSERTNHQLRNGAERRALFYDDGVRGHVQRLQIEPLDALQIIHRQLRVSSAEKGL